MEARHIEAKFAAQDDRIAKLERRADDAELRVAALVDICNKLNADYEGRLDKAVEVNLPAERFDTPVQESINARKRKEAHDKEFNRG